MEQIFTNLDETEVVEQKTPQNPIKFNKTIVHYHLIPLIFFVCRIISFISVNFVSILIAVLKFDLILSISFLCLHNFQGFCK